MFRRKKIELPLVDEELSQAVLVRFCKLDTTATDMAVAGRPTAAETDACAQERAARAAVQGRINTRLHAQEAMAEELRGLHKGLPDPKQDPTADMLGAGVGEDVVGVLQEQKTTIVETLTKEKTTGAERAAFKQTNGVVRAADYKESWVLPAAGLVGACLIEAAIGLGFYLQSSSGVLSAALTAVGVPAAAMLLAGLAGYFPARALHLKDTAEHPNRRALTRRWAIPTLLLLGSAVVFIALFAGHYRQYGVDSDGEDFAEALVLGRLLATPLSLSLASYALVVIAMACAAFAFVKGYRGLADVHPGYRRVDLKYVNAKSDSGDLRTAILGRVDEIKIARVDTLEDKAVGTRATLERMDRLLAELTLKKKRDDKRTASDVQALVGALGEFRKINLAVRNDHVIPLYMQTPVATAGMVSVVDIADLPGLIHGAKSTHAAHVMSLLDSVARQSRRIAWIKENIDVILAAVHLKGTSDEPALKAKLSDLIAEPGQPKAPAAVSMPSAAITPRQIEERAA